MNYADILAGYRYIKMKMLGEPSGTNSGKVYVRSGASWDKKEEDVKDGRDRKDGRV